MRDLARATCRSCGQENVAHTRIGFPVQAHALGARHQAAMTAEGERLAAHPEELDGVHERIARLLAKAREDKKRRLVARGLCPGPEERAIRPGEVDVNKRAACPSCGKHVKVSGRGRFANHKPNKTEEEVRG